MFHHSFIVEYKLSFNLLQKTHNPLLDLVHLIALQATRKIGKMLEIFVSYLTCVAVVSLNSSLPVSKACLIAFKSEFSILVGDHVSQHQ